MRWALIAFTLLAWSWLHVQAGEVLLSWDASASASGYHMVVGTASGTYGEPITTAATTGQLTGLAGGCTPHFAAVSAFNAAGESDHGDEVSFMPRPIVTAPPTDDGSVMTVVGDNFGPGITVEIDGSATLPISQGCGVLVLPLVADWLLIELCNGPVCLAYPLGPPLPPTELGVT